MAICWSQSSTIQTQFYHCRYKPQPCVATWIQGWQFHCNPCTSSRSKKKPAKLAKCLRSATINRAMIHSDKSTREKKRFNQQQPWTYKAASWVICQWDYQLELKMETCPGSLQLHQFQFLWSHPNIGDLISLITLGIRAEIWATASRFWLAFAKHRPDLRQKMSQVTVTTGSTSLFRGPQRENHGPGAMSDLVKPWWTIEYCESCDDGHNFHPLQCCTDMKVCLALV